jgi:HAE1 family hydrophobic/amphiphilic exporter-1
VGLTERTLRKPVTTLMIVLGLIVAGIFGYRTLQLELYPEVNFAVVSVTTIYPGAGPEEIDTQISRRIEEGVSGVNGLRQATSSSQQGISTVVAEFEIGVDQDRALQDIRAQVDRVVGDLPKQAERPVVEKVVETAAPVVTLAFTSDRIGPREVRTLVSRQIADRFRRIEGVAEARIAGGFEREIRVEVLRKRLIAYGIGILDLQQQLRTASSEAPAGRIDTGREALSLRAPAGLRTAKQVAAVPITITDPDNTSGSRTVPLGLLARVIDASEERREYTRVGGADAVTLELQKAKAGNAVQIAASASAEAGKILNEFAGQGIRVVTVSDQSKEILNSLKDLQFDILFAIVLVCGTVYLFLHNFRGALIVAIAIPICLFTSILVMKLLGITLNQLSMIGLTLAIAVLVDDAIVVLENTYRHLAHGEAPVEAALKGRMEIGMAAIAITLADVVVFAPVAFMGGILGLYLRPLAIAFVIAVLVSLLVSFTITPLLAARWYKQGEDLENPTGWFSSRFERGFGRIINLYKKALAWSLHRRWSVFLVGNAGLAAVFVFIAGAGEVSLMRALAVGLTPLVLSLAIGGLITVVARVRRKPSWRPVLGGLAFGGFFLIASAGGFLYSTWKGSDVFSFTFLPASDSNHVVARVQLPAGTSIKETERVVEHIERAARRLSTVREVLSEVGTEGTNRGPNFARVEAILYEKASPKDRMTGAIRREKLRTIVDDQVAYDWRVGIGKVRGATIVVAPLNSSGPPIQVSLQSADPELLVKTSAKLVAKLKQGAIPGLVSPEISARPGQPELLVAIDRLRLADAGLDPASVGEAIRVLYEGDDDVKARAEGSEFAIRLLMAEKDRKNPAIVKSIPLSFVEGRPIYLGSVASVERGSSPDKIDRRDRSREVQLSANLLPGFVAGSVQIQLNKWLSAPGRLPKGVSPRALGDADLQARETGYLVIALVVGLALVYMLLASLYENLLYPFIIQLSQPQAMVGAIVALMLTDKAANVVSFIGLIALVGLVGKNAILIVDYANTLRREGENREQALIESGGTRLRPIVMTSLALLLGMMPIAVGLGRGSEFRDTIGIVIVGGISLSTLLTLFVIPCSYTIFDDLSESLKARLTARSAKIASSAAPEDL